MRPPSGKSSAARKEKAKERGVSVERGENRPQERMTVPEEKGRYNGPGFKKKGNGEANRLGGGGCKARDSEYNL